MQTPLQRAIEAAQGATVLAKGIGVSPQRLGNWHLRGIPAEFCPRIERFTRSLGRPVPCEVLRPDVEWSELRRNPHVEAEVLHTAILAAPQQAVHQIDMEQAR